MQINRYTKTSNPRYDPMSLQELMMAPAYKRQQHDASQAAFNELNNGLAQIDSLDVHGELAQKEQQKLYDQVNSKAELLAKEGFTNTTNSDILKLNKDYQFAIGPNGILGKINNAKKVYEQQKADILANSVKQGYGAEETKAKIDQAYEAYKQGFDGQNVTNFEGPLPPAYQDLQKDIMDVGAKMGSETITKLKQKGYEIGTDNGMFVIKTKGGEVIETSNDSNINSAIDYLNSKWLDEKGLGTQSAEWQNLDSETIKEQINSGLGLQREFKSLDNRQDNYRFMSIPEAKTDENNNPATFLNSKIQGFTASNISPDSPLLSLDKVQNLKFNEFGNIDSPETRTYENMISDIKQELSGGEFIKFNNETGLYDLYSLASKNSTQYSKTPIYKQGSQLKPEIDNIRQSNPFLNSLSDKELVERMQSFKENLSSNYITSSIPIGAKYEWTNDYIFGNSKGGGESSAGTIMDKGATINGKQLTYDQVIDDLGYDNMSEFKEDGKPTVQGFVPALGKFRATAYDSDGNPKNIFIEGPEELQAPIMRTKQVTKALMEGKSFENLGPHSSRPDYNYYMINNFDGEPIIILSKDKVNSPEQLVSYEDGNISVINEYNKDTNPNGAVYKPYSDIAQLELYALNSNPIYKSISGIDKTTK